MHDLTEVSPSSSLTTGSPLSNNNLLSPLFTALGWQDLKPAIIAAEQADQALALELQQAYDAYSKTPDAISQQRLQRALDQTIGELQADLSRVRKLEKEAAKRLAKPQTTSGSYLASWLKQGAQAFFGSDADDASLVGRYGEIAKKRTEEITQLSRLREGLALPIVSSPKKQSATVSTQASAENIASPAARHLLETETPPAVTAQYCSPNGACDLSNLHEGVSGFVLQGEAASDWSGYSVSSAGDINGDGFDDILVGASHAAPAGLTNAGKTYVVFGSNQPNAWGSGISNLTSLMDGQSGFVLNGEAAMDYSGGSVSRAGDINGDKLDDILVGAAGASPAGRTYAGKIYVIFGSNQTNAWGPGTLNLSNLMNGQRGFVLQGEAAGDESGYCVSGAGDINGDTLDDILLGAPGAV